MHACSVALEMKQEEQEFKASVFCTEEGDYIKKRNLRNKNHEARENHRSTVC